MIRSMLCGLFCFSLQITWSSTQYFPPNRGRSKAAWTSCLTQQREIIISLFLCVCPIETVEIKTSPMWPRASRTHIPGTHRAPGHQSTCFQKQACLLLGGLGLGGGPKLGRKLHFASPIFLLVCFFETLSLHRPSCPRTQCRPSPHFKTYYIRV